MKNLNLVPADYQERLKLQRLFLLLKSLMTVVIFYFIFLGLVLLAARLVLQRNFNRIVDETTLVTSENRAVERRIAAFNRELEVARAVAASGRPWGQFLVALTPLVPAEVQLTSLKLEVEPKRSTITGHAETRDALLAFRDALAGAAYIADVDLPITNLLRKTDLDFTVTFAVNLPRLSRLPDRR